ncbi:MAG TPA: ABC transporter permease [Candidatus Binatia bacterium]|nr:ABC transporter permease [Candidatus Binatia bacterium]
MNTANAEAPEKAGWRVRLDDIHLRNAIVYLAFIAILLFFSVVLRDRGFLTTANLLNIIRQTAPVTIMAVGMTFTLSAGEIDLSIGSTVALSALVAAVLLRDQGFVAGVVGALVVGLVVGLFNGLLTVKVRIPSFLVTLGSLGIVSGLARTLTDLQSVPVRHEAFIAIFGGGNVGPVSTLVIWTVVAMIVGHAVLHNLRFGRHVLATGGQRKTARYVGINTDRIRIAVLVISAMTASLAGLLYTGRLAGARYTLGEADLLTVIAAVIIGGTSLFGGRGSVVGAVVGSIIMGMLNNGLILMGLEVAEQMIARGIIIILAVALSLREPQNA